MNSQVEIARINKQEVKNRMIYNFTGNLNQPAVCSRYTIVFVLNHLSLRRATEAVITRHSIFNSPVVCLSSQIQNHGGSPSYHIDPKRVSVDNHNPVFQKNPNAAHIVSTLPFPLQKISK